MTDSVAANGPELTWRGAATKRKSKLNHKGHEEHEVYNQIISEPFVAFVRFVVRNKVLHP